MNIRRIFPMEVNLVVRNLKNFIFSQKYKVHRIDEKPICFYLDAATYNNLGDQAISLATEWFLNDLLGKDYVRVVSEADLIRCIRSLKAQIYSNDIIVLGGGGNMGDLYPRYEALRRLVIKMFPNNKIIIFPQTIDYSSDTYGKKELQRAMKIYGSHKNLVVCAREIKSFYILNKFCRSVILVPDIVFYLMNKMSANSVKSFDFGICLRDDKESIFAPKKRKELFENLEKQESHYEELTTISSCVGGMLTFAERKKAVKDKLDEFAKYKIIITDRLHGMIFCILAGIPCVVLDNSNHKVFGVYEVVKELIDIKVKTANSENIERILTEVISWDEFSRDKVSNSDMYMELAKTLT